MNINTITAEDLRRMPDKEGLILQGCGGDLTEWVDGINEMLTKAGILKDGCQFENVAAFQHGELTCLLYPFDDVKLDIGKLALWRLQTHEVYGGTWLSDFVPNYLGGFIETPEALADKPDCPLIGADGNIFNLLGIVLCSATQPCLEVVDHPLRRQPVDLVPQQKALWDIFKRTDIQNAGCARLEELPQIVMGALSSCDSLLVVCNTKKEAAFLFESLQAANCRCFHLSAAMCVQHRRETLQALQSALDKPSADRQRVVCVSTQVIEAGVDISFQRVIRFSAGMDSVVQAAGRCNRHAEQKEPAPVRLIRCTDERLRGLDDIVRGQNATTALLTAFSKTPEGFRYDLSSEEAIRFYYRRLYAEMEPGFQDNQTPAHGSLYHLLADNPRYADANCAQAERYLLRQAFRLAGSLFQVFDEDTRSLLVPYGRGRELQNTLRNAAQVYGQKDWAVIRGCIDEAKGYCVSVYRYQLERLEALGAVTSLFDGGILLLSDGFYNEHTGFSLEAGTRDFQEV